MLRKPFLTKSKRINLAERVAHMGEKSSTYRVFIRIVNGRNK
jgi:hypothetical protein